MRSLRTWGILALVVVTGALAGRALRQQPVDTVELRGSAMGTTWSARIDARAHTQAELRQAQAYIQEAIARVDERMSTWRKDSELSRFNRHASTDPFPLSPDTYVVFELASEVSAATGGAFDITVRPLVAAWGFGAGARAPGDAPEPEELEALRQRVGRELIELDPDSQTVRKLRPDVECDLSAIAKGFAVDLAVGALESAGFSDFMVELGGEVAARGQRPGGGGWRIGIELPDAEQRAVESHIALLDGAMATSGDYRSFYEQDGRRLAHIIDPRSGRPTQHALASVTVVHRSAALADAWATALEVLGPDEGLAHAEREGLAAYLLIRTARGEFDHQSTSAFEALAPMDEDSSVGGWRATLP